MPMIDVYAAEGTLKDGRAGRLSLPNAFAAITAIFVIFAAAASAPTPLYVVYQREWGFSDTTLTVIFAVYVLGLIGSLLVLGGLSDHVGRRPLLAGAIALEGAAFVLFIVAGGVTVLLVARAVQGIATGIAFSTLGATLVDLNPVHSPGRAGLINGVAPISGLALGALGCGALVQYAPAPTHLVFALLLAGMVFAGGVVARLPETSAQRPGAIASLVPVLGIPVRLRPDVYGLVPIIVASWALGGLYLSLGPSVAAGIFGPPQPPDRRPGGHAAERRRSGDRLCAAGVADQKGLENQRHHAFWRNCFDARRRGNPCCGAGVRRDGRCRGRFRRIRPRLVRNAGANRSARRAQRVAGSCPCHRLPGFQPPGGGRRVCQHLVWLASHDGGLQPRCGHPRSHRVSSGRAAFGSTEESWVGFGILTPFTSR